MTKRRVYIDYLGCDRRKLDTQRIIDFFRANSFEITPEINQAGLCIFVTCGFDDTHQQWTLTKLDRIIRIKSPSVPLIISGCLPSINPKVLSDLGKYIPLDIRHLDELDTLVDAQISMDLIADPNLTQFDHAAADEDVVQKKHAESGNLITPAHLAYQYAKRKFKIRINEGCLGNCSFCVTRLATGQLISKPLALIMEEFQRGLSGGQNIFFLTGGDSGAWG